MFETKSYSESIKEKFRPVLTRVCSSQVRRSAVCLQGLHVSQQVLQTGLWKDGKWLFLWSHSPSVRKLLHVGNCCSGETTLEAQIGSYQRAAHLYLYSFPEESQVTPLNPSFQCRYYSFLLENMEHKPSFLLLLCFGSQRCCFMMSNMTSKTFHNFLKKF